MLQYNWNIIANGCSARVFSSTRFSYCLIVLFTLFNNYILVTTWHTNMKYRPSYRYESNLIKVGNKSIIDKKTKCNNCCKSLIQSCNYLLIFKYVWNLCNCVHYYSILLLFADIFRKILMIPIIWNICNESIIQELIINTRFITYCYSFSH